MTFKPIEMKKCKTVSLVVSFVRMNNVKLLTDIPLFFPTLTGRIIFTQGTVSKSIFLVWDMLCILLQTIAPIITTPSVTPSPQTFNTNTLVRYLGHSYEKYGKYHFQSVLEAK